VSSAADRARNPTTTGTAAWTAWASWEVAEVSTSSREICGQRLEFLDLPMPILLLTDLFFFGGVDAAGGLLVQSPNAPPKQPL